jgi:hypothetical protein
LTILPQDAARLAPWLALEKRTVRVDLDIKQMAKETD